MDGEDDWDQAGAVAGGGEDDWDQAGGGAGQIGEDGEAAGGGGGSAPDKSKVLLMRFCPHDSSMLYPQEHRSTRTLRYACRLCRYSEESPGSSCGLIYRNSLTRELGNVLATVPAAVADDPTLPRSQNASCMNCGHHEAVFFQSDTSDVRSDSLALIFVCCNCGHKWVT
jgi:DNA-directed RNA polymerase II subunit RPB9